MESRFRVRLNIPEVCLLSARSNAMAAQHQEDGLVEGQLAYEDSKLEAHVLAAITMAAAYLEASINEYFEDAIHPSEVDLKVSGQELDAAAVDRLSVYWDATQRGRRATTLDKYQAALRMSGAPDFDPGASPYQEADLVVRLRNWVMHYKATWHDVFPSRPTFWETALRGRFDLNRFVESWDVPMPFFPQRVLGAGCASWSWQSAQAFHWAFQDRMPRLGPA